MSERSLPTHDQCDIHEFVTARFGIQCGDESTRDLDSTAPWKAPEQSSITLPRMCVSVSERRFLVDGMYCPERLSDGDCVFRIPASGVPDVAPCAGLVASSSAKQRDALEQNSDKLFVVAQGVRTGRNFLVRGRIVRWLPTQETSAKRAKRRSLTSTEYAIELQRVSRRWTCCAGS